MGIRTENSATGIAGFFFRQQTAINAGSCFIRGIETQNGREKAREGFVPEFALVCGLIKTGIAR